MLLVTLKNGSASLWLMGGLISLSAFILRGKRTSKLFSLYPIPSPEEEAQLKEGVAKIKLAAAMIDEVVATISPDLQPLKPVKLNAEDAKLNAEDAKFNAEDAKVKEGLAKLNFARAMIEEVCVTNYPFRPPPPPPPVFRWRFALRGFM